MGVRGTTRGRKRREREQVSTLISCRVSSEEVGRNTPRRFATLTVTTATATTGYRRAPAASRTCAAAWARPLLGAPSVLTSPSTSKPASGISLLQRGTTTREDNTWRGCGQERGAASRVPGGLHAVSTAGSGYQPAAAATRATLAKRVPSNPLVSLARVQPVAGEDPGAAQYTVEVLEGALAHAHAAAAAAAARRDLARAAGRAHGCDHVRDAAGLSVGLLQAVPQLAAEEGGHVPQRSVVSLRGEARAHQHEAGRGATGTQGAPAARAAGGGRGGG
jgi:hypothetical protein